MLQQLALLGRMEEPRREAGSVNRRPEAVTRPPEVLLDGGGVETGVDAAEEDVEIAGDDVRQRGTGSGGEIGFGRLHSIRTTASTTFGKRVSTAGSWPGMMKRGSLTSVFILSCAARFDAASNVCAIGTCFSRFS